MFVAAVLSFLCGIYAEALQRVGVVTLLAVLAFAATVALSCLRTHRRAACVFMLAAFFLAGMVRQSLLIQDPPSPTDNYLPEVYSGTVEAVTTTTATLRIESPAGLANASAIYRTSDSLQIGDRVKIWGKARELSMNFKNPHVLSWRWVKRLEGVSLDIRGTVVSREAGRSAIQSWRQFLREKIERSSATCLGMIKALTIGDTTGLDEPTRLLFLRTGTSHILAISGSNLGIVCTFFFFVARGLIGRRLRLRLRGDDSRYAAILTIPVAALFMVIAGAGIPLIRATIMIAVFMIALFFERQRHPVNTLAISALIILVLYPHSLFTPSFQLTFLSVLFIILFSRRARPLIQGRRRIAAWAMGLAVVTFAASLGTLPAVIYHFCGFNPLSLLHNAVAVPLMCAIAMPLAVVGVFLPYGDALIRLSGEILSLSVSILRLMDYGYLYPVIRPTLFEHLLFYSFVLLVIALPSRRALFLLCLAVIPVIVLHASLALYSRYHGRNLTVSAIDVGLGESLLVEGPRGLRILVDGGGFYRGDFDVGRSVITPVLLARKIITLDYVISTHPHGDHVGGLLTVVRDFDVRILVTGARFPREPGFLELVTTAMSKKIPLETWGRGEVRSLGREASVQVLHPDPDRVYENPNEASLVLRFLFGRTSFLLTGDIGEEAEQGLVASPFPLTSDVLKVPHHGSNHASTMGFLDTVSPSLAVLSVGRGIPGLPGETALARYRLLSIPVLRTDHDGFIEITSDGQRIRARTFSGRRTGVTGIN